MYNSEFIDSMTDSPTGGDDKDVNREDFLKEFKTFPKYFKLVGSGRYSHKKFIGDVDLISLKPLGIPYKWISDHYDVIDVVKLGKRILTLTVKMMDIPIKINVWYSTREELPTMIMAYAYPRQFVIAVRRKLKNKGYKLSQLDLTKGGEKVEIASIKEIFELAEISFRSPENEGKKLNA